MYNSLHARPVPLSFGQDTVIPKYSASIFSRIFFGWVGPLLDIGYLRPLEKDDLWQIPRSLLTEQVTADLEQNFYARCPRRKRPRTFCDDHDERDGRKKKHSPLDMIDLENLTGDDEESEEESDYEPTQRPAHSAKKEKYPHDESLLRALHTTFFWPWWISGFYKLSSDTLKTTTPLVSKLLLTWLTDCFMSYKTPGATEPQGIAYGFGLALALFLMQEVASLLTKHGIQTSMSVGIAIRTSITGAIYRKSLRLSGRARTTHSVGQITNMISTDASRLDKGSPFVHNLWVAPIQIVLGLGLLIHNLGYSALVGLAVMILGFPIQIILAKVMINQRKKLVELTDHRVRLLTEILHGIRLIKYYAWETLFSGKVARVRVQEMESLRIVVAVRGVLIGTVTVLPFLAAVASFITFALAGHELNVAVIFSSFQSFSIIRSPLIFLPMMIANCADVAVALTRISTFLTAEELSDPYKIDPQSQYAIDVQGDFQWDATYDSATGTFKELPVESKKNARQAKKSQGRLPTYTPLDTHESEEESEGFSSRPFSLKNVDLKIPKGCFVAIVGRIGSGKSSLLQALLGEMRKTRGTCVFSATAAYAPQTPWIMNATLRDNITFGRDIDQLRLQEVISACSLDEDLAMLPNGELTEIGEKGINLSGGQKARVSLARAAYSGADIVLMDDSLSAVDAYVGKRILEDCLLSGPLAGKTRVLVTHSLQILDKTDYIYVMDKGVVVGQGTYRDLIRSSAHFSRIIAEFGTRDQDSSSMSTKQHNHTKAAPDTRTENEPLMQEEERLTGAVTSDVYLKYFQNAGSQVRLPIILVLTAVFQCSQIANSLTLGFWTSSSIHGFGQIDYMKMYAATGISVGVTSFALSFMIGITTLSAAFNMARKSLWAVLHSAVSFFDTTPMGRVTARLSKDQDTIDTGIAFTAYQLLLTISSIFGTVGLVVYTFPFLTVLLVPLSMFYYVAAMYYRRTSVEVKRLESIMRSAAYASYSETLTGLSTVRAYREQDRFIRSTNKGLDLGNRASYVNIAIERWLSIRLDLLGNALILGIAVFAVVFRNTLDPSRTGVVLSYSLGITQVLSDLVSLYAEIEQTFNAVERVLHYAELPPEGAFTTPNDPPSSWPQSGEIRFEHVKMSYRPGLPTVLKDISFDIKPGQKVGIVGRTGAGKSSLLQVLFRFVDIQDGSVTVDGHDIANVGLEPLRSRLALVPQDSTLFLGTLRENLDPQGTRTDSELIDALRKTGLLPREGSATLMAENKFSLDATVSDEGANYSAGEKQLLSLCRAMIKGSKIIVLDEATSNVDVETDAKLQQTIQTELATSTILCVAHRLNTIVYYDRILVMDAGRVAEFDTPLALFDKQASIFRSLCNEAGLTRQDIIRIRKTIHIDTHGLV